MGLLRGPADGQRPAGLPPRALARVQGHLPPLQDDARLLGRPQGRLGLPRPAGRDRGREAARHRLQGGHRALRHRRVQPALPRVGVRVPRGVGAADRADRLLDRPRRRLPHPRQRLHRVGLVGAAADLGPRAALRGPQGRALLPALRHGAVLARGRAGLPGRRRPVGLRALPGARAARAAAAGRRAARLDDDAVDARLQRRGRRRSRRHLRAGARRTGETYVLAEALVERVLGEGAEVLERFPGRELVGTRYEPPLPLPERRGVRAARATPSCRPTSSPPRTAPASCTPRSPSARTTSGWARSTG